MAFQAELAAALAVIALLIWCYKNINKSPNNYLSSIPGPTPLPIVGNALDLNQPTKFFDSLMGYIKEFGETVQVRIGPFRKIIVVTDYKLLEYVLSSTKILNKSRDYLFFRPWLGTGLLTSDGPKWKKRRRMITPAFHFKILEQFIESFESAGEVLLEKLEKELGKPSTDIYSYVTLYALDVICESAMGTTINAQENSDSTYVRSVKEMCRIVPARGTSPIAMYDLLYPLTADYHKQKKALKILHEFTDNVINTRRQQFENKTSESEQVDDIGIKKKMPFLDILLQSTIDGKPLEDEDIREEVDTFMFEGHDTTTSAVSFILYSLANNPEVQDKVLREQENLFRNIKSCTYEVLQEMKYLELVIKEVLRLYPSVPLYLRDTNEDVEYEGKVIPKDTTLMVFAFGMHRSPKYFPDPYKFDPDRFNSIDGRLPYAYIPFSAGPRNCVGQKFAMLEMKCIISKIVRRFELVPAFPEHVLQLTFTTILKSANGVKVGLRRRT